MSTKTREKFWMEFKVYSNIRNELFKFEIHDEDLNINDDSGKRNIQFNMRNYAAYQLFKKKLPIYIKDSIAQIYQEIDIGSNPVWLKFLLDEKAGALIHQIASEQKSKFRKGKKKRNQHPEDLEKILIKFEKYHSKEEKNFYNQIRKKASISLLDFAIIVNENNLDDLVYLFDRQTIIKNLVFFDLFQHWFESPAKVTRIDEFIRALKRKIIKPGPKGFSEKEKQEIVFCYEYLRRIFKKIKKEIEIPNRKLDEEKIEEEWNKLEAYLLKNSNFRITNENMEKDWFEKNFSAFRALFLFEMSEGEANEEIEDYKRSKISSAEKEIINREARLKYLKSISSKLNKKKYFSLENDIKLSNYVLLHLYKKHNLEKVDSFENIKQKINKFKEPLLMRKTRDINEEPFIKFEILRIIKKKVPSELSIFLLSKIYGITPRKTRRAIDSNKKLLDKSSLILSAYPCLKLN